MFDSTAIIVVDELRAGHHNSMRCATKSLFFASCQDINFESDFNAWLKGQYTTKRSVIVIILCYSVQRYTSIETRMVVEDQTSATGTREAGAHVFSVQCEKKPFSNICIGVNSDYTNKWLERTH